MNKETAVKKKKLSKGKIVLLVLLGIIALIIAISVVSSVTADFEYEYNLVKQADGTYAVCGIRGEGNGKANKEENQKIMTIPAEYQGTPVHSVSISTLDMSPDTIANITPKIETIIISEGITTIDNCDFECFENLKKIVLPSSLTKIDRIWIPTNVEVEMKDGSAYKWENSCIYEITTNTVIRGFDGCTIPEGAKKIAACAFEDTTLGNDFVLPLTLTEIGASAFAKAKNMPKVLVLGEHIKTVNSDAFAYSKGIETLRIATKGTIFDSAFAYLEVATVILDVEQKYVPAYTYLYENESTIPAKSENEPYLVESDMPGYRKLSWD